MDGADITRYLDVIAGRVESRQTGAQWLLNSVGLMRGEGTRSERLAALTAATWARQHPSMPGESVPPVHEWSGAELHEGRGWIKNYQRVGQYMTTNLFTVQQDDTIDLVMSLMDWEHIRHVPVEDEQHQLVGLVSYRPLLSHLARNMSGDRSTSAFSIPVRDIMKRDVICVTPETRTVDAVALMREHRISCLPVTSDGRLIGIITEHDFMALSSQLIEEALGRAGGAGDA